MAMAQPEAVNTVPAENWHSALLESLRSCSAQRTPVDPGRRFLLILAFIGIAVAIAILRAVLPAALNGAPPEIALLVSLFCSVLAVMTLARWRNACLRQLRQMKARSAEAALQRDAARRPVVYLRAFRLDQRIAEPSFAEKFLGVTTLPSNEQKVATSLGKLGPVIAIGRPDEQLPPLGAARFYVSQDLWQVKVVDAVNASQVVVCATGITDGLRWEISHLIENHHPRKLVLWAHPHLLHFNAKQREAEWSSVLGVLGEIFPKPLPSLLGDARFICFAADWTPIPIAPSWRGPIQALRSFIDPMGSALRQVRRVTQARLDPATIAYQQASRDLAESNFADLIGVGASGIRWSRILAFGLALFLASLASDAIAPVLLEAFSFLLHGDFREIPRLLASGFIRSLQLADPAADATLDCLEWLCACIAFWKLRDWRWAAIAAAAGAVVLWQFVGVPLPSEVGPPSSHARLIGALLFPHRSWIVPGFSNALRTFFPVGLELLGLSFAVQRFSPLPRALWIGEAGSAFLAAIVSLLFDPSTSFQFLVASGFISATIFAFALSSAIRITSRHGS
jgi:hypothetical protein